MRKLIIGMTTVFVMGFWAVTGIASPEGWILNDEKSTVAFGSVKKDTVGESHHFTGLTGAVKHDGAVTVDIDLSSVETWIDKRNERMIEYVFLNAPKATFTANVDMAALENLAVGDMTEMELKGMLTLGGTDIAIQTPVMVVRLAENKVMVITSEMIWVSTEEAGIDEGVTKLMELAKLPGITRAFPVTFRLVFEHDM